LKLANSCRAHALRSLSASWAAAPLKSWAMPLHRLRSAAPANLPMSCRTKGALAVSGNQQRHRNSLPLRARSAAVGCGVFRQQQPGLWTDHLQVLLICVLGPCVSQYFHQLLHLQPPTAPSLPSLSSAAADNDDAVCPRGKYDDGTSCVNCGYANYCPGEWCVLLSTAERHSTVQKRPSAEQHHDGAQM
jgi:hypothetical protein